MYIKTRAKANVGKKGETGKELQLVKIVRPTKVLKKQTSLVNRNTGRWEKHERMTFLQGFRQYGKGKWKQIGAMIPSRTTIQVKTHAQMVIKRMELGEDVFAELDLYMAESEEENSSVESSSFDLMSTEVSSSFTTPFNTDAAWIAPDAQDVSAAKVLTLLRRGITSNCQLGGSTSLQRQVTLEDSSSSSDSHSTLP